MATYVLVHGGDRDGSIWDEVANLLRSKGHTVVCPSMTSVTVASVEENIKEIIKEIEANQLSNIILVGHSYGGFVITGVNDKLPDKIAQLIYVDSFVPKNGKSLYGMMQEFGYDYKKFGLTPDKACLDPLFFDEQILDNKNKTYIRCLQSEFFIPITPVYEQIIANKKDHHWLVFCLDAKHGCMFTHSKELVVIFLGSLVSEIV